MQRCGRTNRLSPSPVRLVNPSCNMAINTHLLCGRIVMLVLIRSVGEQDMDKKRALILYAVLMLTSLLPPLLPSFPLPPSLISPKIISLCDKESWLLCMMKYLTIQLYHTIRFAYYGCSTFVHSLSKQRVMIRQRNKMSDEPVYYTATCIPIEYVHVQRYNLLMLGGFWQYQIKITVTKKLRAD
jgi:hypothetical protein